MWRLFWIFSKVGFLMFGGSVTAYTLVEQQVLKYRLLSRQDLLEIFTMTYVLPGPNSIILASFIGKRCHGGFLGSIMAVLGVLLAPVLLLFLLFSHVPLTQENEILLKGLEGMRIALIVVILNFLLRLLQGLTHKIQLITFLVASTILIVLQPHPAIVILGSAFLGLSTYRYTKNSLKNSKIPRKDGDFL